MANENFVPTFAECLVLKLNTKFVFFSRRLRIQKLWPGIESVESNRACVIRQKVLFFVGDLYTEADLSSNHERFDVKLVNSAIRFRKCSRRTIVVLLFPGDSAPSQNIAWLFVEQICVVYNFQRFNSYKKADNISLIFIHF